ncbi:MAG: universal stress protein [Gammaproteobacteria bacterium]|nr:universal stress protein [Gammaproteobacteria bacterium]
MLPDINTIVYATDLSVKSAYAFRYAVYLADRTDAKIHVLHVAERLPADAMDTLEDYLDKDANREQFLRTRLENSKKLLRKRFDSFWDSLDEHERSLKPHVASLHVVESKPAESIIAFAEETDADLIVMGTHQKGPMQAMLGSISRRVLNMAKVPTLVVPIGYR